MVFHGWCPEGTVVIRLLPALEVQAIYGDLKHVNLREIKNAVADRLDDCIAGWRKHHG